MGFKAECLSKLLPVTLNNPEVPEQRGGSFHLLVLLGSNAAEQILWATDSRERQSLLPPGREVTAAPRTPHFSIQHIRRKQGMISLEKKQAQKTTHGKSISIQNQPFWPEQDLSQHYKQNQE